MRIYVPTSGRPDRQITSNLLCAAGVEHYVVSEESDNLRSEGYRRILTYSGDPGIRAKRDFIWGLAALVGESKVLMLDDDLRFRRRDASGKFPQAGVSDIPELIETIGERLDHNAHVGIADEFMSQHLPRGWKYSGRYNQVLGYNLSLFPKVWPEWRVEINEEHDVSLQLQAAGLPPAISCEWTKSSKHYAAGGCSAWRTPEVELSAHRAFASLWPGLVSVVPHKGSPSGYGIRVNWKKASAGC